MMNIDCTYFTDIFLFAVSERIIIFRKMIPNNFLLCPSEIILAFEEIPDETQFSNKMVK